MMSKKNSHSQKKQIKALALMSGGLDSVLAAKVIHDLGIEVTAVTFVLPWKSYDQPGAVKNATAIGIPIKTIQLDDDFLNVVKNPNHGYGAAINPCIDCKIYMLKKAEEYRKQIHADFLFTGEVLGQRPMSQNSHSMKLIERKTGLVNQIVRPLSAQMLDPTEAEINGLIDRTKLLDLNGRSRKGQMSLAKKLQLKEYEQPAGGCHLTEKSFARRLQDYYALCHQDYRETENLMYGRHYRITQSCKAILGRDAKENDRLLQSANKNDYALVVGDEDKVGPLCLLKGENPPAQTLNTCGALIKRFSKYKNDPALNIKYWKISNPKEEAFLKAKNISEEKIQRMEI